MVLSHCRNKMLPTAEREFLLNHCSYSFFMSLFVLTSTCFHVWPLACLPLAQQLQLYSSWPPFKEGGLDALCQVILSLGKSAPGYGKMAFTCLHAGSDGWLPICVASLTAQGLCFLVLSETYSCPNEEQTSGLLSPSHYVYLLQRCGHNSLCLIQVLNYKHKHL